jgi:hypothetical protein
VNPSSSAQSAARLTGVVDTLSAGYGLVNRRIWVVLIPVLLDLFLLFGPQVSAARLVSQSLSRVSTRLTESEVLGQDQQRDFVELVEGYNLLSALASSVVHVPSLMAAVGIRDPLRSIPVETWGALVTIFIGAILGGLLLGSLYYALLAQQLRDGAFLPGRLLGYALRAYPRVLGYLLVLGGIGLLFGLPIGFLMAGAYLMSPVIGNLAVTVVTIGVVWAWIYLFFVPEAIFVSGVGPLRAIKNSVAVVRGNFRSAVGIVLLVTVILMGMGRVWDLLSYQVAEPWGLWLSILGNAYIASGLIAASMCFYRERIGRVGGAHS